MIQSLNDSIQGMLFHPSHPGEVLKDYLGDMKHEGKNKSCRLSLE
jgi:hypothetical protein